MPDQPLRQNTVAGLVSREREGQDTRCADTGEPGLFDLGDYARCSLAEGATCEPPSTRVVTAMTELPDGTLETHFACLRRETQQDPGAAMAIGWLR